MRHATLTTSGLVLRKRAVGESNTLVTLLTQEKGLVTATARSARAERSKLRYALEPFTDARFSLVRGAYEWKIIGAVDARRASGEKRHARIAAGRVARLLSRLIHGEEVSPVMYRIVAGDLPILLASLTPDDADGAESVIVLRILRHLGYLPHTPALESFVGEEMLTTDIARLASTDRRRVVRAINDSLAATGL